MTKSALRAVGAVFALVAGLFLILPGAVAYAGGQLNIDHSELAPGHIKLLVSVPGTAPVDLTSASVSIDGRKTSASAVSASKATDITRTTVLAIDTSKSMAGPRITEAKRAANAYLDQVPANVKVGIVTFDSRVKEILAPTLDRSAAKQAVARLTLSLSTHLYDGVVGAVKALGTTGQRQILLLSDGKDTTGTSIQAPIRALKSAKVKLDVVSLQQSDSGNASLNQMAQSTSGAVINAQDPQALSGAFASEADVLARQILVSATVPAGVKSSNADVSVALSSGGQIYSGNAYLAVRGASTSGKRPAPLEKPIPVVATFNIPRAVMLGSVAAIGVGLIGIILAAARKPRASSGSNGIADQISAYGARSRGGAKRKEASASGLAAQARQAAESVLANNRGIEARIAKKLEGAGMVLKPSEWLLVHALIVIGATGMGVLLAASNPALVAILFFAGLGVPWLYLVIKKSRRLSAFNASLADTLQLMSGSLSAGLSLAQSLDTIVREGTEPITSEFRRVIVETRLGVPLEDALDGVADRMESQDFKWVVMAIKIQREVGGNLAELLLTVAATLREREYLRRHVKALSAEGRLSCWILGGLPPLFLLYLTLTKPTYVSVLYTSTIGWILLGGMGVLLTSGIFWMTKVAKVDL